MDKLIALDNINKIWNDIEISLDEKIKGISSNFYAAGLDLSGTASYIKATQAELDSLLLLSELEDEVIKKISDINPPKTTWMLFANASNKEIEEALNSLDRSVLGDVEKKEDFALSEYVFNKMVALNGPTIEEKVLAISCDHLKHVLKKGEDYKKLNEWSKRFLKNISALKKKGKDISGKQINCLIKILNELADEGVIKRDSIDGDQLICNHILDALER